MSKKNEWKKMIVKTAAIFAAVTSIAGTGAFALEDDYVFEPLEVITVEEDPVEPEENDYNLNIREILDWYEQEFYKRDKLIKCEDVKWEDPIPEDEKEGPDTIPEDLLRRVDMKVEVRSKDSLE